MAERLTDTDTFFPDDLDAVADALDKAAADALRTAGALKPTGTADPAR